MNETIYSLVTKPINQNIAVIRISGPDSFLLLDTLMKTKIIPTANRVEYRKFYVAGNFIDEGLVLMFKSPNSFTGENVVEIQTHGSMRVIEEILSSFGRIDFARQAKPGEFTKQAFVNNKIDLTKAAAINDLILSENNDYIADKSRQNINGMQRKFIDLMISKTEEVISKIQVSIDYPENTDIEEYSNNSIESSLNILLKQVKDLIEKSKRIQKISDGITVVVVGEPNVGKSTLINEILGEERIIVSDIKGTTRDVIDVKITLDGILVTIKDTAGLRKETNDKLEKMGMSKTIESLDRADIILYLQSYENFSKVNPSFLNNLNIPIINVITKSDLDAEKTRLSGYISISSKESDIDSLLKEISTYIKTNILVDTNHEDDFLTDKLQVTQFEIIQNNIESALNYMNQGYTSDFYMFEIESIIQTLYKVIGKNIDPDYINELFGGFCLGK